MNLPLVELPNLLAKLSIPLYFLLAWLLLQRRIVRPYRVFVLFLIVEGTAQGLTVFGASRSLSSFIYQYIQPALWCLYILMVLELFRSVFRPFPGIARFSQWVVAVSLVVALAISFSTVGVDLAGPGNQSLIL